MNSIATTIEQSRRLLELGLSPESADMYYTQREHSDTGYSSNPLCFPVNKRIILENYKEDGDILAWSLSALIEVMPAKLGDSTNKIIKSELQRKYFCVYGLKLKNIHEEYGDTPLEAAYNMVVWLLENNYIKKESNH